MKIIISICSFFVFVGCNSDKKFSKIYISDYCNESFKNVSFKSTTDSASFYDGQLVEMTGYYNWGTEESAISLKKYSGIESRIWTEFSKVIADSLEENKSPNENVFEEMQGKKITIRGTLEAGRGGHLGQYACSIKYICYLEVFE